MKWAPWILRRLNAIISLFHVPLELTNYPLRQLCLIGQVETPSLFPKLSEFSSSKNSMLKVWNWPGGSGEGGGNLRSFTFLGGYNVINTIDLPWNSPLEAVLLSRISYEDRTHISALILSVGWLEVNDACYKFEEYDFIRNSVWHSRIFLLRRKSHWFLNWSVTNGIHGNAPHFQAPKEDR